ncbi:N-acetylmuramoyl-L-alanine amidase [Clostridium butyricum]|uniref:N-acetylmuramoyl-L-alanine amidase n=1 Tax=Clostridium butyricum TaxID=1492 RepID=UPI00272A83E9|nr:N-acetylmuramoyl-L-alanine amidase [Clostridium butyricum]
MKFGIDLGHGVGKDRGAVGNIAEETIINSVGSLVISKLKALGHSVIELRPDSVISVNDSLQQRYNKSDYYNVDMCVSIHANAGGGVGAEVFTYNAKEVSQARAVLNNIVKLGFRNRGIKDGSHLAMVRNPKATSMLIEICFVDSSDVDLYNTLGAEVVATEIVLGLTGQVVNTIKGEWILDNTGWWYKHSDGSYTKDGWEKIDNKWYLFNAQGYMLYSWQYSNGGNWYYLGAEDDGAMKTGWVLTDNKWYYMNCDGAMQIGWQKIDNEWYYFDSSGAMQTGWIKDNGKDYLLYSNGAMAHDTIVYGYRFDSKGVATKI